MLEFISLDLQFTRRPSKRYSRRKCDTSGRENEDPNRRGIISYHMIWLPPETKQTRVKTLLITLYNFFL